MDSAPLSQYAPKESSACGTGTKEIDRTAKKKMGSRTAWEVVATLERFAFMLVVGLLVNIFVEAGVLRFFYKTMSVRKLLLVSTVMNLVSYVLLIFWFLDMFASQLTFG